MTPEHLQEISDRLLNVDPLGYRKGWSKAEDAFADCALADMSALLAYVDTLERLIGDAQDESACTRQAFLHGQKAAIKAATDRIEEMLVDLAKPGKSAYESAARHDSLDLAQIAITRLRSVPFDLDKHRQEAGSFRILTDLRPGAKVFLPSPPPAGAQHLWFEFQGQEATIVATYLRRIKVDSYENEEIALALRLPNGAMMEAELSAVRLP